MRTGFLFTYLSLPLTILRGYLLFIVVNEGGRFDFVAELKVVTLAGECREIFIAAIVAFHTGKVVVDVAQSRYR
jgi:hypothetical protein